MRQNEYQLNQFHQNFSNQNTKCKMDILFYSAIQRARHEYVKRSFLHLLKLVLLIVFLVIDTVVLKTSQSLIIIFMGVSIAVVSFNLLITITIILSGYGDNQTNNSLFIQQAAACQHLVANQFFQDSEISQLKKCTSPSLYNCKSQALNNDQGLTQQVRGRYQSVYSVFISQKVMDQSPCISFFQRNGKFASFLLLIFGIVALCMSKPSPAQIGVLTTFLVLQALNIWIFILAIIILALSPVIIALLCVVLCCCVTNEANNNVPQTKQITSQMIQKTDGTCSICFQNFMIKQEVIPLRCSEKHVFHKGCLQKWLMVSRTCPMCRKDVNHE